MAFQNDPQKTNSPECFVFPLHKKRRNGLQFSVELYRIYISEDLLYSRYPAGSRETKTHQIWYMPLKFLNLMEEKDKQNIIN